MSTQQRRKGGQAPPQPSEIHSGAALGPLQELGYPGLLCLQTSLAPELNFKPFEGAIEFPYLYAGNTKGHVISATQRVALRPSIFLKSQVLPNKVVRE